MWCAAVADQVSDAGVHVSICYNLQASFSPQELWHGYQLLPHALGCAVMWCTADMLFMLLFVRALILCCTT